jgi:hypothetical protein
MMHADPPPNDERHDVQEIHTIMSWLLILSTLPHFYSILPLVCNYERFAGYIHVVILSTTLSVFYHTDESNLWIAGFDYFMALIWFLYDLRMGWPRIYYLFKIVKANLISFIIFHITLKTDQYVLHHSLWHLCNAAKCYYVATLLVSKDSMTFVQAVNGGSTAQKTGVNGADVCTPEDGVGDWRVSLFRMLKHPTLKITKILPIRSTIHFYHCLHGCCLPSSSFH